MTPEPEPLFTPAGNGIVFVLDRTGSMQETLTAAGRLLVRYLIRQVAGGAWADLDRVGLITLDDHYHYGAPEAESPNEYEADAAYNRPYDVYGMTANLEEFGYWLATVRLGAGDDADEAHACAIRAARALDPTAAIWVVTDAFGREGACFDAYKWDVDHGIEGCDANLAAEAADPRVRVLLLDSSLDEWDARAWASMVGTERLIVADGGLAGLIDEPPDQEAGTVAGVVVVP